jgi:rhodanese-related sulfurtransferase
VTNLKTKGINNAAAVLGGFEALKSAGFEVVKGSEPNGSGQ